MRHPDSAIIDKLGGTTAVARIFRIRKPSVSEWRKTGIPEARRMYLEAVFPEVMGSKNPVDNNADREVA